MSLRITQLDPTALKAIQKEIGGSLLLKHDKAREKKGLADGYVWQVSKSDRIREIASRMLPHLRSRMEIVLRGLREVEKRHTKANHLWTEDEEDSLRQLWTTHYVSCIRDMALPELSSLAIRGKARRLQLERTTKPILDTRRCWCGHRTVTDPAKLRAAGRKGGLARWKIKSQQTLVLEGVKS